MPRAQHHFAATSLALGLLAALTATEAGAAEPDGEPTDDARFCRPGSLPVEYHDGAPGLTPRGSGTTIFVNMDGETLTYGYPSDSRNNVTSIQELAGTFAAHTDGSIRAAVLDTARADFADFDVSITDQRPQSGDYTMIMLGPTDPYQDGTLGIAPLDCGNYSPNDLGFAFQTGFANATLQGSTVSHEAGHTFGLDHTQGGAGELMAPAAGGGDLGFTDACLETAYGSCNHSKCSGGQQNAYQELMAVLGPAQADAAPPTVTITAPVDGDTFDAGADFAITVDASDDVGVQGIALFVNGSEEATDASAPWGWDISAIPEGTYELHVLARDAAGNEATSNVVTIEVGQGGGGDGGGGGQTGDGGDDGGTDDGAGDGGGPGAFPPGGGFEDDRDMGCGCTTPAAPAGAWLLVVLGALLRRRRG